MQAIRICSGCQIRGVGLKRAARAFTKPRSPESWSSVAVGWVRRNRIVVTRLSDFTAERSTLTLILSISGDTLEVDNCRCCDA